MRKATKPQNCFIEQKEDMSLHDALSSVGIEDSTVTIHGIDVPCDTKINDIIPSLLYPDGFLYITVQ